MIKFKVNIIFAMGIGGKHVCEPYCLLEVTRDLFGQERAYRVIKGVCWLNTGFLLKDSGLYA